jgi:glycerate-2-kinase
MMQPAFGTDAPLHNPLAWIDDPANGTPRWTARRSTPELQEVARFTQSTDASLPWRASEWRARAPELSIPEVTLIAQRTASGARARVTSPRGADRITLLIRNGEVRSVNGVAPAPRAERHRSRLPAGWSMAIVSGGQELVVDIEGTGKLELIASDTSFSFPPEGAALARARDAAGGTAVQDGDVTSTRTRLTL